MGKFRRSKNLAALVAASLMGVAELAAGAKAPGGVPNSLWNHFTRGVNITRWFNYTGQNNPIDHFKTDFKPRDFQIFNDLKLGFVRLCIGPQEIYRDGDFDHQNMPFIDQGVAELIHNGQVVIWDLHDNSTMGLSKSEPARQGFLKFWQNVARHYRGQQEKMLVFELKNEPVFAKNPQDWYSLQAEVVRAIRKIDSRRTIMVSATEWSGIDALAQFKPLPETNLIYTVHCYDPFLFTHQGASWVGNPPSGLQHMPFPANEDVAKAILAINEPQNKGAILWYGNQKFDEAYLKGRMQVAMDYAHRNRVPMVLGEFGSNPPKALPDDRARWFAGMRKAFDSTGMAWCLWGYDDGMGLGRTVDASGHIHLERDVERNLFRQDLGQ